MCPMFGFKDSISMKDNGSPHLRVAEITIPLLCLNAEDDPICLGGCHINPNFYGQMFCYFHELYRKH